MQVIDEAVNYVQDLYMNVNKIVQDPINLRPSHYITVFCIYKGTQILFRNFNEVASMDKRKLLALRQITVILS